MQVEDFDRAVSALFSQGNTAVSPATRCEAEQYLRAVCDSSSGALMLLSALQSRCSFEAKFFALQQLLQLLPQQQQEQRQQVKDILFSVMRLRVCSVWACSSSNSSSNSSGGADNPAAQLAAAASDPGSSPDAAGVHNKLALLVARLLAAEIASEGRASSTAASEGKVAFLALRLLLHQELNAICLQLQETENGVAAAAADIADRCIACRNPACAVAAGRNLAASLESVRVALRVLLVLHQEYLEDLPASALSAALKSSFPFDEEVAAGVAVSCPPPFSPLLLQLLRLLQLAHKHSPALGSVLQLCCSVAEKYVGWMDLLLPPAPPTGGQAEARSSSSNGSPNLLQLLGSTWLATGFSDAASAIVVFIHRKMEPAARIDLLCRMELIEWLLHEIPLTEVAASPAMIVPFATMVNAATAALTDATATLAEKLEAVGASDVLGPVAAGSNNTLVADRNPREVLQQGLTALWAVLPLSVQLLGSGGLEVSSAVVPALSVLLTRAAMLQRQDSILVQPLTTARLQGFLLELLQVLIKRLAEVDMLKEAAEQQYQQQQQQQVVYSSLDDEELEQLCAYKEALTGLFRKACAADQTRVLQWIQEGILQHMQHLQHLQQQQQGLQQRREQQQQLAALLHMLLIMTDDISDLPEKLKDTSSQLHACLVQLLQLLHCMHSCEAFSCGTAAENFMRVLVRIAPLLSKQDQQQHIPEALSLLAGPHGVCSSSTTVAPRACLALLRFVKNCLPSSAAYTGLLLRHLLQQQCLDIPRNSNNNDDLRQQRIRSAVSPSCGNSSRQEPRVLAAAADVYVLPRAFQVEQQLLLFEAAGVLLGCKQHLYGRSASSSEEHVMLLHALLAKATAAFTSETPSAGDTASSVAVYCSRCANALASLSKGFQPFKPHGSPRVGVGAVCSSETEADAFVLGELKKSWLHALQLFTDAVRVACAERSPLEVGGTSLVLLPPFLHACVFLLRRLLSLLGPLAASSIGVLVPLLFDAVLVEANSTAAGTLEQQQHSPELAAELLSGFFMQLFVSLKGPPLLFLLLQHFPLVLERHLSLYMKAVAAASQEPNSAELQRECRGVQEQLAFVLATAARETPESLLRFAAASLLDAESSSNNSGDGSSSSNGASCFVSAVAQCLEGDNTAIPDGNWVGRQQHALLQLLHQQQQLLHVRLFGSSHAARGAAAVTSRVPEGTPAPLEIASVTWRCMLLLLLLCCYPGGSPTAAAAAAQAWAHLVAALVCKSDSCVETEQHLEQQQQQQLQQVARLPFELQQLQEAMRDFNRQNAALEVQLRQRRSQGGPVQTQQQPLQIQQSEEMQLLRQQQQQRVQGIHLPQAGQQLSLVLPLPPLFSVTARLLASLKNDDPQHVKLATDIGSLWRVCGYGIPPGSPQRTASAAAAAAATAAAAQFVSFFTPLRSGLQEALKDGLAERIGDSDAAATAAAALIEALGQTDGQQLREVMRTWAWQFLPK